MNYNYAGSAIVISGTFSTSLAKCAIDDKHHYVKKTDSKRDRYNNATRQTGHHVDEVVCRCGCDCALLWPVPK